MENNNKVKMLGIIFAVVLIGVGLFDLGFTILYKNELEGGSCELCFKLNPNLRECENYKPINLYNQMVYRSIPQYTAVDLKNITVVSYGK